MYWKGNKQKIKYFLVLSSLALTLILSGCTQPASDKIIVRFMGWGAQTAEYELYDKMIADFEDENSGIRINYEVIVDRLSENVFGSFAAGVGPDVFYLDSSWAPKFIAADALYAIDDLTTQTVIDQYYDFLLSPFTGTDGKVYGLPKDWSMLQLYYNKDLLSQAGWTTPPDTWAELKECAINITDETGKAGLVYPMEFNRWVPLLTSNGASEPWFDSAADADWLDETKVKDSLEYAINLYLDGRKEFLLTASTVPYIGIAADVDAGWRGDAFGEKDAGMVISGNWMIPFMNSTYPNFEYDTDWGIAPVPKGSAGRSNMAYTVALGINAKTDHPEEAWKFVEFLLGEEGQTELVVKMGQTLPSIKGLEDHADLWPQHAETLSHTYGTTTVFVWGPQSSAIDSDFNTILGSAMKGEITAAAAFTAMKDAVEEAFED